MELWLILRVLLRRWWLVLIPPLVVTAIVVPDFLRNRGAASGGFATVVNYSAAQVLEAIPGRDGDYQDVWLASELTVNALTAWVQTTSFKREVAAKLAGQGLEIDPFSLNIVGDNERSVGRLYISWPDEGQLPLIAQAALDVLQTRSGDYFPQLGQQPAQVTLLDEPVITPAPPPIVDRLGPFIRLGLAFIVGVGLAFLAEYLDPTVRDKSDVEALGLTVITSIPRK